ncbi:hypothetical protein AHS81_23915, partial [Salmonella enterica]|nr:hypothetical protein [Salmonella enterica]EAP0279008.1 hypothetical protein [Salmonella enterica]EAS2604977.1 hypothetical protein [Salmonella enterica]
MKSINVSSFDSQNTRVEKFKVSGFDVIVTTASGEQVQIIDGLPDILIGSLKLFNKEGKKIEAAEIVNSIDSSKLGLDVAVLSSIIQGSNVESGGDSATDKTSENVLPDKAKDEAQAEKLIALQVENMQLKDQIAEAEKQSTNEEKIQLQVERTDQQANEVITAAPVLELIPSSSDNLKKKKGLLDDSSGGSSSSNNQNTPAGNTQQEVMISKNVPLTAEINKKSDTGTIGDNITSITQPVFNGITTPSTQVTLTIGNVSYKTTADAKGNWTISVTHDLAEGGNAYTVSAKDAAGNSATISGVVVIDTVAQTITVALDSQSDSGVQGDFITHDTTPTLTGTAEAGAAMTLVINGTTYTFNAD